MRDEHGGRALVSDDPLKLALQAQPGQRVTIGRDRLWRIDQGRRDAAGTGGSHDADELALVDCTMDMRQRLDLTAGDTEPLADVISNAWFWPRPRSEMATGPLMGSSSAESDAPGSRR